VRAGGAIAPRALFLEVDAALLDAEPGAAEVLGQSAASLPLPSWLSRILGISLLLLAVTPVLGPNLRTARERRADLSWESV